MRASTSVSRGEKVTPVGVLLAAVGAGPATRGLAAEAVLAGTEPATARTHTGAEAFGDFLRVGIMRAGISRLAVGPETAAERSEERR